MNIKILVIVLLGLVCLPALASLFAPGMFESHDGKFHIARIWFVGQEIKNGQFPVRWLSGLVHGAGYPTLNYYYPLGYYLAQPTMLIGSDAVTAYKLLLAVSFCLSGVFMFLWARLHWGNLGGFVSAFVYLYSPYRFTSMYVNGTFGVCLAFAIVPFLAWQLFELNKKMQFANLALVALGWGLLFLAHNTTAMIFTPLLLSYCIYLFFQQKNKLFIMSLPAAWALAIFLAAFFLLPAFGELEFVKLVNPRVAATFQDHFPAFNQLLYSRWGYGYSLPGVGDGMSFQLGLANWIIVVLSLVPALAKFPKKKFGLVLTFLLNFLLVLFLMLPVSEFIWRIFPILQRIEFPWKLLSIEIFIAAFLAGALARRRFLLALAIIFLAFFTNRNHLRPLSTQRFNQGQMIANTITADTSGELLPIWVKRFPYQVDCGDVKVATGAAKLEIAPSENYHYFIQAEQKSKIVVGTFYFPGWKAYVDDREVGIDINDDSGVISFWVESGSHDVKLKFQDTWPRLVGNYLSGAALLVIGGLIVKNGKIT